MSITKSYDRGVQKQCLLDLRMFEGTGTATVQDIAKPHHPMTLTHSPTWVQLSSGLWVLDFNRGHPDFIQCPAALSTDMNFTTGDFSGCAWVSPDTTNNIMILGRGLTVPTATDGWQLSINSSNALLFVYANGTQQYASSGTTLSAGNWYFVAFTRAGTMGLVFINGREATGSRSMTGNPTTANRKLLIGVRNDESVTGGYDGKMWGHRVWSRLLAPSEVMEIFNRERHLFGV